MPDTPRPDDADTFSHKETVARRDATLKRLLATPPKPHKEQAPKRG